MANETSDGLSLLSLNMMLMCNSYERTKDAYLELLQQAGFRFESAVKINLLQTMLIAEKP